MVLVKKRILITLILIQTFPFDEGLIVPLSTTKNNEEFVAFHQKSQWHKNSRVQSFFHRQGIKRRYYDSLSLYSTFKDKDSIPSNQQIEAKIEANHENKIQKIISKIPRRQKGNIPKRLFQKAFF